jgi:ABC-type amino acid transport substrate-binding protein
MKATLLSFAFIIMCSIFSLAQVKKGDSWAKTKADGSGTLAVLYNQTPGLIAKQADGSVNGVCVDILTDFQKFLKEKYKVTVSLSFGEEADFPVFLTRVQQTDNLLGVTNTSITEERKKIMKFTPLFMNNQVFLLTHQSVSTLKSLTDISTAFKGFKAQVISGSTHALEMEKIKKDHFPELQIEQIPSGDVIIKNLSANKQLFSIIDFTEFIGVVKNRIPVKKHDVVIGTPEPLGFVMSKRSDWDQVWAEFLTLEYRKSVRYKEIIANNLGQSFMKLVH